MAHPDLDALAEAYFADRDPAFSNADDLAEQRERWEGIVCSLIENAITDFVRDRLTDFQDDEIEYMKENADYFGEYLTDRIEDLL